MKKLSTIIFLFIFFTSFQCFSQNISEQITFTSSNPFSFNDVITNFDNLEKQEVFGELVIPHDSLNPQKKFPLIIGVAGSLGWKSHHLEYLNVSRFRVCYI
jgi:hypothetical protein